MSPTWRPGQGTEDREQEHLDQGPADLRTCSGVSTLNSRSSRIFSRMGTAWTPHRTRELRWPPASGGGASARLDSRGQNHGNGGATLRTLADNQWLVHMSV